MMTVGEVGFLRKALLVIQNKIFRPRVSVCSASGSAPSLYDGLVNIPVLICYPRNHVCSQRAVKARTAIGSKREYALRLLIRLLTIRR